MKSKQRNKKNGMFLKNELEITAPFITVFDKMIVA